MKTAEATQEYEPFGPEWEKEVMKLPKKYIIHLYRQQCIERKRLEESKSPSIPTSEEIKDNFYCKEFENVGYQCEEQCGKCSRTGLLESPKPAATSSLDELEKLVEEWSINYGGANQKLPQKELKDFWNFLKPHLSALLAEIQKENDLYMEGEIVANNRIKYLEERIKEEAIGLLRFIQNENYSRNGNGTYYKFSGSLKETIVSPEELYSLYLQSLSTKPSTEGKIGKSKKVTGYEG